MISNRPGVTQTQGAPTRKVSIGDFSGDPSQAKAVRLFVYACIPAEHPRREDAMLPVSETFTNALRHSRARQDGKRIRVVVAVDDDLIRISVQDPGGNGTPTMPDRTDAEAQGAEGGRGLEILDLLTDDWGWHQEGDGSIVVHFSLGVLAAVR